MLAKVVSKGGLGRIGGEREGGFCGPISLSLLSGWILTYVCWNLMGLNFRA